MSRPLVFMMRSTPVFLPVDRRYATNHFWTLRQGEVQRFGLSAYAVRLLGQLRELAWSVESGTQVALRQAIGEIEGSKAISTLHAPGAGTIVGFNRDVLFDPALLNSDPYASAWLLDMHCQEQEFLSPEQYLAHVEAGWPLVEQMFKKGLGTGN